MIFDDILTTHNGTGGSGNLTLVAQTGHPRYSDVITGTWAVDYTIIEYTDSTKSVVLQRESGVGTIASGSSDTLTRSIPTSTFSSGVYVPKFNTSTMPTALTFGNVSANFDITCAPTANNSLMPIRSYNNSGAGADGVGLAPLSVPNSSNALTFAMVTGTVYYFPIWLTHRGPFTKASFRVTTAATAGTSPIPAITTWIHQPIVDTGLPGKRLINFGSSTVTATAPVTVSTTTLATPISLPSGWYWLSMLYLVGNGSGAPTLKGYTPVIGFAGTSMANYGPIIGLTLPSQSTMADPGTAPTGNIAGYVAPLVTLL